jgi:hypothetical protein
MTADPGAPTTARSSPTEACTAPDPRAAAATRAAAPAAAPDNIAAHDQQTAELARHKLGPISADGYYRVMCPAAAGRSAARTGPSR